MNQEPFKKTAEPDMEGTNPDIGTKKPDIEAANPDIEKNFRPRQQITFSDSARRFRERQSLGVRM